MIVREAVVTYRRSDAKIDLRRVVDSRSVADLARTIIPDGPQERFVVVGLDAKNVPIGWQLVGAGGLDSCPVEAAAVFRWAVLAGCSGIILIHNHPSGDPAPSAPDRDLTLRLVDAGDLLGVRMVDHVVVGHDRHYSFLDSGLLPTPEGTRR